MSVREVALEAKQAARELARISSDRKERALHAMASALEKEAPKLLQENRLDLDLAQKAGLSRPMLDRLTLTERIISEMARGIREVAALPDPEPQVTNFYEAVRNRTRFALNESNGHRSCTLVNLAKTAVQLGRNLRFDPKKQRFVDDDAANRLLDQPMRAPWHV